MNDRRAHVAAVVAAVQEARPMPPWDRLDERTRLAVTRAARAQRADDPQAFYEEAREAQARRLAADREARETAAKIRGRR